MQLFEGTGVALVTPFKNDLTVDFEAVTRLVHFVIDGGVDYLVILGTTGEPATLSHDEKELVIATIIAANNSRLPLVLGVGGNSTQRIVDELQTRDFQHFSAILSVSPYYNKPTQEGVFQHFSAIAKASPLPIILYNVPGRTASNMLPDTVFRLANAHSNIIGIKEAAGDMVQAMQLLKLKPKDFLVISGDDILALPMILAGGSGVISVIGQGFPSEFSKMIRLGLTKNVTQSFEIHYALMDIIDMIFEQGNPAGIKQVLQNLGICQNHVRLPLVEVDEGLAQKIKNFVDNLDENHH